MSKSSALLPLSSLKSSLVMAVMATLGFAALFLGADAMYQAQQPAAPPAPDTIGSAGYILLTVVVITFNILLFGGGHRYLLFATVPVGGLLASLMLQSPDGLVFSLVGSGLMLVVFGLRRSYHAEHARRTMLKKEQEENEKDSALSDT